MKILFDARVLSKGFTSGIEEYAHNLLTNLVRIKKQHRLILFYSGLRKRPLDYSGTEIIDWRVPNKLLDLSSRFLNWPLVDRATKADVVFSPHFNILNSTAPRVITFHDLSFVHHPYFFSIKHKFWHWLQNYQQQAQRAVKLIAVSEFTKSDLVNLLNIPPEKITTIYSGISDAFKKLSSSDQSLNDFKNRHQLTYPFLLHLATLEPRKNAVAVIKAFNLLKARAGFRDFKLILAGRRGWLYQNILRAIKQSPHAKDIILWGVVSNEEKIFLYNLASVFVYPSFFEGFGFPPLEAQACGCPVVAADRTSLPEILGDSALLVDPWRVADLADAIAQVIENNSLRQQLIQAGLNNVRRFSWSGATQKTLNLLTSAYPMT